MACRSQVSLAWPRRSRFFSVRIFPALDEKKDSNFDVRGREVKKKASSQVCSAASLSNNLLSHPLLREYWPSERRAVLTHRFYLSLETDCEISLEETLMSWEEGPSVSWRREKMRIDGQRQLCEIERHKYFLSQKLGYDVGWEPAAKDWIENYAAAWRAWWEEQPASDP